MQNQQQDNLEDIIINSNKGSNLKKLMLVASVLLLVLILIILITKSLVQPEDKKNTQVILPPEPVSKPIKAKEPLFEDVPIENENRDTKIDEVIGKIKNQAYTEKKAPSTSTKSNAPKTSHPKKETKSTNDEYYIQVGAFFNYPPDKKFLNSITKEKLSYVIVKGEKNGKIYEKVMIGPYPSREKAKKALPVIRKRINQNAYITKK